VNDGSQSHGRPTGESLHRQRLIAGVILVVSFFGAAAVRVYNINAAKLYFSSTSQYESFCIARQFYFESTDRVADWRRRIALANNNVSAGRQPPITEYLVSLVYRASGRESHWAPSLVSSVFWLVGGVFIFLTTRQFTSAVVASIATGYYLFAPFGILMSRSIQGESLMAMMFAAGVYFIFTYYRKQSTKNLLFAGVVCGAAILSKVNMVFSIWAVFLAGGIYKRGIRKAIFSREHFIFVLLGIIPGFIYYSWGSRDSDCSGQVNQ